MMSSRHAKEYDDNENYFNRYLTELQEKLKQSEEERIKLVTKLSKLQQKYKSEDELRKQIGLRDSYNLVLQQEKWRNNRNSNLKEILEKIENEACFLTAKTDRLRLLRQNYEAYMEQLYPGWRTGEDEFFASYRKELDEICFDSPINSSHLQKDSVILTKYNAGSESTSNTSNTIKRNSESQTDFNSIKNTSNSYEPPRNSSTYNERTYSSTPIRPSQTSYMTDYMKDIQTIKPTINSTKTSLLPTPILLNTRYSSSYASEKTPNSSLNSFQRKDFYKTDLDKDENTKSDYLKNPYESQTKINSYSSNSKPWDYLKRSNTVKIKSYSPDITQKYLQPITINKFVPRYLYRSNSLDNFSLKYLQYKYKGQNSSITRPQALSNDKSSYSRPLYRSGSFGQEQKFSLYTSPSKTNTIKHDNHVKSLYKKYITNPENTDRIYNSENVYHRHNNSYRRIQSPTYSTNYYSPNLNISDYTNQYRNDINYPEKNHEPYKIMNSYINQLYPNISRSFSISSLDDLDYLSRKSHYNIPSQSSYPSRERFHESKNDYLQNPFSKYPSTSRYISKPTSYNYTPYRSSLNSHKTDKATITDENMLNNKRKFEYQKPLQVHYADEMKDNDIEDTYKIPSYNYSSGNIEKENATNFKSVEPPKFRNKYPEIKDEEEKNLNPLTIDYRRRYNQDDDNDLNTLEERTEEDTSLDNPSLNSEEVWENKIDKLKEFMNYESEQGKETTQEKPFDLNKKNYSAIQDDYLREQNTDNSNSLKELSSLDRLDKEEDEKNDQEKDYIDNVNPNEDEIHNTNEKKYNANEGHVGKELKKDDDITLNTPSEIDNYSVLNDTDRLEKNNQVLPDKLYNVDEFKGNLKETEKDFSNNQEKDFPENISSLDSSQKVQEESKIEETKSSEQPKQDNTVGEKHSITSEEKINMNTKNNLVEMEGTEEETQPSPQRNKKMEDVIKNKENPIVKQDINDEKTVLNGIQQIPLATSSENIEKSGINDNQVDINNTHEQNIAELQDLEQNISPNEKDLQPYLEETQPYTTQQEDYKPEQQQYPYDHHEQYSAENESYPADPQQYADQNLASQYSDNHDQTKEQYLDGHYEDYQQEAQHYAEDKQYPEESNTYPTDTTMQQYAEQSEGYPHNIPAYNEDNAVPQYQANQESQPQYDQQMYYENYDNHENYPNNSQYEESPATEPVIEQPIMNTSDQPEHQEQEEPNKAGYPEEMEMYNQNPESNLITSNSEQNSTEYTSQPQNEQLQQEYTDQQKPTDFNYPSNQTYDQYGYDPSTAKSDENYPQYYEGDQYQTTGDKMEVNPQYNPEQQYPEYPQDQSGVQYQDQNYYDHYQGYQNPEEFPQQSEQFDNSKKILDDANIQNIQPEKNTDNVAETEKKEVTVSKEMAQGNSKKVQEQKPEVPQTTKPTEKTKESNKPTGNGNSKQNATGKPSETMSGKAEKKDISSTKAAKKSEEKPNSQQAKKSTLEKMKSSDQGKK